MISDFRVRDVAAGGEGAPLVPLVDHLLFRAPGPRRALQNIGGIANVTLVGERLADLVAFDNAPGNMPLDAVARAASDGVEAYDVDGRRAARGTHRRRAAGRAAPPSLPGAAAAQVDRPRGRSAGASSTRCSRRFERRSDDLLATLTRFSAEAIARSYREASARAARRGLRLGRRRAQPHADAPPGRAAARPSPCASTAALGVDPEAKEAIAFAVLANETLFGAAGNVPAVTGAAGPRVLGKLSF